MLEKLPKSPKYVPPYVLKERIRQEAIAFGEKNRSIEIAKELKRRSMSITAIKEITGLTITEINALRVRRHQ